MKRPRELSTRERGKGAGETREWPCWAGRPIKEVLDRPAGAQEDVVRRRFRGGSEVERASVFGYFG
jgi:hypothetical protein